MQSIQQWFHTISNPQNCTFTLHIIHAKLVLTQHSVLTVTPCHFHNKIVNLHLTDIIRCPLHTTLIWYNNTQNICSLYSTHSFHNTFFPHHTNFTQHFTTPPQHIPLNTEPSTHIHSPQQPAVQSLHFPLHNKLCSQTFSYCYPPGRKGHW